MVLNKLSCKPLSRGIIGVLPRETGNECCQGAQGSTLFRCLLNELCYNLRFYGFKRYLDSTTEGKDQRVCLAFA